MTIHTPVGRHPGLPKLGHILEENIQVREHPPDGNLIVVQRFHGEDLLFALVLNARELEHRRLRQEDRRPVAMSRHGYSIAVGNLNGRIFRRPIFPLAATQGVRIFLRHVADEQLLILPPLRGPITMHLLTLPKPHTERSQDLLMQLPSGIDFHANHIKAPAQ